MDENKICQYCLDQLKATYYFINKCLHTESVLSTLDSDSNNIEFVISQNVEDDKHIIKTVFKESPIFDSNSDDITKEELKSNDDDYFQVNLYSYYFCILHIFQ